MQKWILLFLILLGCSTFHKDIRPTRNLASIQSELIEVNFDLSLSQDLIFANGANFIFLKLKTKNSQGQNLSINPSDLTLYSDTPIEPDKFVLQDGYYQAKITPEVRSPNIKMYVTWKNQQSEIIELKTTLSPMTEKMLPIRSSSTLSAFISGNFYTRQENFPVGQFEAFPIVNNGKNAIVSANESRREFEFNFEEQAAQNMSLFMSDEPNGTVSHTMHSTFMFFPRKFIPFLEIKKDELKVTLPTGEEMVFSESGEIIKGVFQEGPVDVGPDRFKRQYADLKYYGKGIVLRANARGQMPQLGQFESTKIDMDFGIKNSSDVLIINGSTGQRCRRPKSDFWEAKDVSPILFKFPTDAGFDAYLKSNCGFGIPNLTHAEKRRSKKDVAPLIQDIWTRCIDSRGVEECLDKEIDTLNGNETKYAAKFELNQILMKEINTEKKTIGTLIKQENQTIRSTLLTDLTWASSFENDQSFNQECLKKSKSMVRIEFKYFDAQDLIQDELKLSCGNLRTEIIGLAQNETKSIRLALEKDYMWVLIEDEKTFPEQCFIKSQTLLSTENRFIKTPEIYNNLLKDLCQQLELSPSFINWLNGQTSAIENKVMVKLLQEIESQGEDLAKRCLIQFPVTTQLERIKFKKDREECLIGQWQEIEKNAQEKVKKDPLVVKINLPFNNIQSRLQSERRRLQLKMIKKYFL